MENKLWWFSKPICPETILSIYFNNQVTVAWTPWTRPGPLALLDYYWNSVDIRCQVNHIMYQYAFLHICGRYPFWYMSAINSLENIMVKAFLSIRLIIRKCSLAFILTYFIHSGMAEQFKWEVISIKSCATHNVKPLNRQTCKWLLFVKTILPVPKVMTHSVTQDSWKLENTGALKHVEALACVALAEGLLSMEPILGSVATKSLIKMSPG